MSAVSNGQLAVGLNGINSYGVTGRSDALRASLKALARNKRRITVRFDHGDPSTREAKKLGRQNWCRCLLVLLESSWPSKDRRLLRCSQTWLRRSDHPQHLIGLSLVEATEDYYRLKKPWIGQTIKREFSGSDLALPHQKQSDLPLWCHRYCEVEGHPAVR